MCLATSLLVERSAVSWDTALDWDVRDAIKDFPVNLVQWIIVVLIEKTGSHELEKSTMMML